MAQAYDDEELSISLSPSQIRRNRRPGDGTSTPLPSHHHQDSTRMASPAGTSGSLPLRDKMRNEQRIGAYNVVKTLGEGSFGKVKLAVHRGTGQQVALKIISRKTLISRDMQGRVEREIEYLQLLRHPHIIKL
jgi:carbon catabolite-derepressing protein kinase